MRHGRGRNARCSNDLRGTDGEVGNDVVERRRAARERSNVANNGKEREEDGHLQDDGQASTQRVELVFRVELAHLLLQGLGIVCVAFLQLLHLGLEDLHLCRGPRASRHERHDEKSHDEREDDYRQSPVTAESVDAGKDILNKANNCVP